MNPTPAQLPDCLYCRRDQRLHDLMIEVAPLAVSTLYLFKEQTYRGRCVVAYRAHVNELFELPESELALFMQDVTRAARAMSAYSFYSVQNYRYIAQMTEPNRSLVYILEARRH